MKGTTVKPFIEQGNFTLIHNVIFDEIQRRLSLSAWAVLSQIIRKTEGWHKEQDDIGFEQIAEGTGIKSYATIRKALMELQGFIPVKDGQKIVAWKRVSEMPQFIFCRKNKSAEGLDTTSTYWLNREVEILVSSRFTENVKRFTENVNTKEEPNNNRGGSSNYYLEPTITSYETKQPVNDCNYQDFEPDEETQRFLKTFEDC